MEGRVVLKELLELFQGTNHIKLRVCKSSYDFSTHRYNDARKAIRDFGDCFVENWNISNNSICITIENNAPTYLKLLNELEIKEEK